MSVEAIVNAAVHVADAEGLSALSIRRVARELGARPMSLYDHIASKDELLWAMGDAVVAEALVEGELPRGWREAMTMIAHRLYALLVRHGWLVQVFATQPRFGPNSSRQARHMAAVVAGMKGVTEMESWMMVGAVNDYVLGHSLRAVNLGRDAELREAVPAGDIAEVPELASLPDYLRTRASVERFEDGLALVLDGIQLRVG